MPSPSPIPSPSAMPSPMPDPLVELIAERFRTMGEPTRIRILERLQHGEASVQELAQHVGTSQQNVSKHLGLLARAGIVGRRKDGTFAYYRITDASVLAMCEQVCSAVQRDIGNLAALVEAASR